MRCRHRLHHSWKAPEAHEPKAVLSPHGGRSRNRTMLLSTRLGALSLAIALALGACQDDIASVDYGSPSFDGIPTNAAMQGSGTDSPDASQSSALDVCHFGTPVFVVHEYLGWVYRQPAIDMQLPDGRQIVDLKGGPDVTHTGDLITWACTQPAPNEILFAALTAEDPADLEGFSMQLAWIPESAQPFARVVYGGPLPPGHPQPWPVEPWRELVVELWGTFSATPLARVPFTVYVCEHPLEEDCVVFVPPPGG